MKQFSRIVLVGVGLWLVAVVLSSLPSHPVAAANGGPSVTVVAPLPLPVTGTVNGSVSISGTPSVNVLEEGTPFATTLCAASTVGACGTVPESYMIPATSHLILEYTSGSCGLSTLRAGDSVEVGQFGLAVTTAGVTNSHSIANSPGLGLSVLAYPSQTAIPQWAQAVKLYGDPGTAVTFLTFGSAIDSGSSYCTATISGRLTP
jgi:hypothetical protein